MRQLLLAVVAVAIWAGLTATGPAATQPAVRCQDVQAGEHVAHQLGLTRSTDLRLPATERPDLCELALAEALAGWALPDGSRLFRQRRQAWCEERIEVMSCSWATSSPYEVIRRGSWTETEGRITVDLDRGDPMKLVRRGGQLWMEGEALQNLPLTAVTPRVGTIWPAGLQPQGGR